MMVAAGLADALTPKEANEYTIQQKPGPHFLNWSARDGEYVDGMQYAPALCFRCTECALITYAHPMDKPAPQTTFHFEKQVCPDDVYAAYLKLFEAWQAKGKRKLKGAYERVVDGFRERSNETMDSQLTKLKDGAVVTL